MYNIFKNVKADVQFGLLSLNAFFFCLSKQISDLFFVQNGS